MSTTRRSALLVGAAAVLPVATTSAAEPPRVEVLQDLLAHERRLAAAYEAALRRDAIDAQLGRTLLANERDHVRGVERALSEAGGRRPLASVPDSALGRALSGRTAFARYALGLEADAVTAYERVLPELGDAGLRRALGSIMVCGATHEVALRQLLGEPLLAESG